MKNVRILFLLTITSLMICAVNRKPVQVYLIGDSIMADKSPRDYPKTGWGQVLGQYFSRDVTIRNRAMDGRTTRSFLNENRWTPILDSLRPGDYVFIAFAHNDEKVDLPQIGVKLEDYTRYLIRYVTESRQRGAIPVLLTPVMRRNFVAGILKDTHLAYADAVRKVAEDYHVPLIDLQRKTEKLLIQTGEEPSKKLFNWVDSAAYPAYPNGSKDNTHLSDLGAHWVAELVVESLKEQKLKLAEYVNGGN